jgi:hypothetical protein
MQRLAYVLEDPFRRSADPLIVGARGRKTQIVIRPASHNVCVLVILTVVVPETNLTYLVVTFSRQGFVTAARAFDALTHFERKRSSVAPCLRGEKAF